MDVFSKWTKVWWFREDVKCRFILEGFVQFDRFPLRLCRQYFLRVWEEMIQLIRLNWSFAIPNEEKIELRIFFSWNGFSITSRRTWISILSKYDRVICRPSMSTSALNITDWEPISVALISYNARTIRSFSKSLLIASNWLGWIDLWQEKQILEHTVVYCDVILPSNKCCRVRINNKRSHTA